MNEVKRPLCPPKWIGLGKTMPCMCFYMWGIDKERQVVGGEEGKNLVSGRGWGG